jgi:hypothetical protein
MHRTQRQKNKASDNKSKIKRAVLLETTESNILMHHDTLSSLQRLRRS